MTERNDERLRELLRKAMRPVEDSELKRDLWPELLRKLDARAMPVPWYDWALTALVAGALALFPHLIPVLFYQL